MMTGIAQELADTLQRIDPRAAERVARLVREILLLAEARGENNESVGSDGDGGAQLMELAAHAEPMGALTNDEIDHAIYGR